MRYPDLFPLLGLSSAAQACAVGTVAPPSLTLVPPFPSPGFPPALIPIWLRPNGLEYFGYWRHFFVERTLTLVSCLGEDGFTVTEVARSTEQLFTWTCIHYLSALGGPTPALRAFAAAVGVDLDACDAASRKVGDDPAALAHRPPFAVAPPAELARHAPGHYRGDFPLPGQPLTGEHLSRLCALELPPSERQRVAARSDAPPWLRGGDPAPVFDALFAEGNFGGAWMALQAPGWPVDRAAEALGRLASASSDPALKALAAAWIAEPRQIAAY